MLLKKPSDSITSLCVCKHYKKCKFVLEERNITFSTFCDLPHICKAVDLHNILAYNKWQYGPCDFWGTCILTVNMNITLSTSLTFRVPCILCIQHILPTHAHKTYKLLKYKIHKNVILIHQHVSMYVITPSPVGGTSCILCLDFYALQESYIH
jgi:hypothetical protein